MFTLYDVLQNTREYCAINFNHMSHWIRKNVLLAATQVGISWDTLFTFQVIPHMLWKLLCSSQLYFLGLPLQWSLQEIKFDRRFYIVVNPKTISQSFLIVGSYKMLSVHSENEILLALSTRTDRSYALIVRLKIKLIKPKEI